MKLSCLFPAERSAHIGEKGFFPSLIGVIAAYLSPKKGKALLGLFIGLLFGAFTLTLLALALVLLGAYAYGGFASVKVMPVLLLFLFYLLQGSLEELLCRGILMPVLSVHLGGGAAAVGSAVFFSLMHIENPGVTPLALLNVFLFGLWFASVAQRSQSLFPVFGLHAGWNFAESIFGLQISGITSPHALLHLESRISWLSGGAFGPEGSPILTVFLLLFLAHPLLFAKKKKTGKKMAQNKT